MKYNTLSTSSLPSEGKKSTLTIYTNMDSFDQIYTESDMLSVRKELEIVQKALKLQTKKCRQLVTEYTRRLQEKEQQFRTEKSLRDDQLAKVLKALLVFEARLRQEQKYISHQLNERDYVIKKQKNDIKKLLLNQYCKNCNQYYTSSPVQESLDSSSEYVVTDYNDYQSSNLESLDSSSENTYATLSDKSYNVNNFNENNKEDYETNKSMFQKNRNKELGRKSRKLQHRKSIGTYFEVLKLRNDNFSPYSNEDNTSNDYENLDSLPSESIVDKISLVSENIENIFNKSSSSNSNETESSSNISVSECNNTVIQKFNTNSDNANTSSDSQNIDTETKCNSSKESLEKDNRKISKISDSIPVFEGDEESNDNWYASASDQEDEEQRDIYRNNPVLECMNQILLQNINDPLNSPPKTPNIERKPAKINKRVKFSDEEDSKQGETALTQKNIDKKEETNDYYETPIQKTPNFYETPQSIYSNDYEQILSKCSESFTNPTSPKNNEHLEGSELNLSQKKLTLSPDNHYYIDMDTKSDTDDIDNKLVVRKSKILREPPALPPKPANLISRYKLQKENLSPKEKCKTDTSTSSEPDYCSISELNLPQTKNVSFKTISVIAEINSPTSNDVKNKLEKADSSKEKHQTEDSLMVKNDASNLVVRKSVDKLNIQVAKQTVIKSETSTASISLKSPKSPKRIEQEIPKLPQVSEILIPDEDEPKQKEERITQDNYVKNNSQIFKLKSADSRRPIVIGTSVSTLITEFNNQHLLSEIKKKPERNKKLDKIMFSSFENLQNLDKQMISPVKDKSETPNFEKFDLSQNFEEFKLDDCEIEEYNVDLEDYKIEEIEDNEAEENNGGPTSPSKVELSRKSKDFNIPNLNKETIDLLKKQLEIQKQEPHENNKNSYRFNNEPTYEHFLECTGLSSKSILTPSRLLSNHKGMLKPKDVKLRSKVKANNLNERHSTSAIKYWSEPYL